MTTPRDLEAWLQAQGAQSAARAHGLSMGAAFVRGRLEAARRGRLLGLAVYLACGCVLAAIAALLWSRPGQVDTVAAFAMGACATWVAGLLLGR